MLTSFIQTIAFTFLFLCYILCDNFLNMLIFYINSSHFKLYILDLIILRCLKSTFDNRPIQKLLLANLHTT